MSGPGTNHYNLLYLDPSQSQPEVKFNLDMDSIDALLYEAISSGGGGSGGGGPGSITVKEVGDSPAGDAFDVTALHFSGAVTVTPQTDGVALIQITGGGSGSDTESLPAGGTTGQVLTKASGTDYDVDWATPSGGGGGGGSGGGNIDADSHYVTPYAHDDDFEVATLDLTKWTWENQLSSTATGENNGSLSLIPSANTVSSIVQPLPNNTAWRYRSKMGMKVGGTDVAGLILFESATGKFLIFGAYVGTPDIGVFSGSASTISGIPFSTSIQNVFYEMGINGTGVSWRQVYWEMELLSGTIYFRLSNSGVDGSFQTLTTLSLTADFTTGPDNIGFGARQYSAACEIYADWFRRMDGASAQVGGGGGSGGGSLTVSDGTTVIHSVTEIDFSGVTVALVNPTSLLLHFNGSSGSTTFTDSSGNGFTPSTTEGTPTIETSNVMFGSGALNLPTAGAGLTYAITANGPLDLGTGDFTLEAWFYFDGTHTYNCVFTMGTFPTAPSSRMMATAGSPFECYDNFGGVQSGNSCTINTWHHVAIVRHASLLYCYLDGVRGGSYTLTTDLGPAGIIQIGSGYPGQELSGAIDEVRITKGVAVYTANFTPPTAAFTVAGVAGQVSVKPVNNVGVAFASLPASPYDGQRAAITDCLAPIWGSAAANGGSRHVPVYYDGANAAWYVG